MKLSFFQYIIFKFNQCFRSNWSRWIDMELVKTDFKSVELIQYKVNSKTGKKSFRREHVFSSWSSHQIDSFIENYKRKHKIN